MDSTSEREKLNRLQLNRLHHLSNRKLAPGVEGKLILILTIEVQLVMPHAYCARNEDTSHLSASSDLISHDQWELSWTTRMAPKLLLELFTQHRRRGQKRHSL